MSAEATETNTRPKLVLIDGHAVAYRQFFGLRSPGFRTKDGEPTNAIYGFTRVLIDLLLKQKPRYLAVTFDAGLSGREDLYADYKGTRKKMPDELSTQIEHIKDVVKAFNVPVLMLDGYEADDIIGTVAARATSENVDVHIITGDRDMLQLLDDHVTAQLPKPGGPDELFDVAAFREKYGLEPQQLVDLKALWGDTSDNIPGVKGIGEKGGTKLLQEFETLDGIYANIDSQSIKPGVRKKLETDRDMAYLSYELATIRRDIPVEWTLDACLSHDYDPAEPLELFSRFEFRTFTKQLLVQVDEEEEAAVSVDDFAPPHVDNSPVETVVVQDTATLEKLVKTLNAAKAIAFDTETTGLDQMQAGLVGIALAVDGKIGYYIPVGHVGEGAGTMFETPAAEQLPLETVIAALTPALTNPNIPKVAHNAAFDLVIMQRHGIDVAPIGFDTMIAEWLRNPISRNLGLKNFAQFELGYEMTPIEALIGKGKKQKPISTVPVADVAPYAAADAAITFRAADFLRPQLEQDELSELNQTLEMPLVPVIAAMERAGIRLDSEFLAEMSVRLEGELAAIEQRIFDLSGFDDFNVNSPKQLNKVLFEHLNMPVQGIKKTTHGYSTDATTLDKLLNDVEDPDQRAVLKEIVNHRELAKLKGTYVDALPALVNAETGRLHTSYNQTGTATGRLSSSDPNLQNIPIRTELGREVRRAFIAGEGRTLLAVDYSQIELRVMAHISGDATLLEAFANDQDIHAATAATVYGVKLDDVTYDQRSFAKRVNFGLMYGMGAFRLARDSDLTLKEANDFIETYFQRLPKVADYIENTKQLATDQGYLSTLVGRKRHFPALANPKSGRQQREAEGRAAINMPIQGTAADIMKKAMIELYDALQAEKLSALMTLQVHDELVLDVPDDELDEVTALVVEIMENTYKLNVPLKANAEIGQNWRDMTPVAHQ